ncbi:MAG TPA: sigma-70 family RNA polymerase sigma factor [Dehalococcoidia bacterium]
MRQEDLGAPAGGCPPFEDLYRRYARSVYNLVLRSVRDPQEAEDLCQEVWYRAQRRLPTLRDQAAFPTWLYRIAARACIDAARRRARSPETVTLPPAGPPTDAANPERAAVRQEEAGLAWQALAALPPRQQTALFLREVEGRSYREIAQVLDSTESAVETLLFRARRGLALTYGRLEAAAPERCREARRAMGRLLDGEGTPIHQRALRIHVAACTPCRQELERLRQASRAYARLPLAAVPTLLGRRILEAAALPGLAAGASGAAGGGALAAVPAKVVAAIVAALTLAAATALPPPAEGPASGGQGSQEPRVEVATVPAQGEQGAPAEPAALPPAPEAAPAAETAPPTAAAAPPVPAAVAKGPLAPVLTTATPLLETVVETVVETAEPLLAPVEAAVTGLTAVVVETVPALAPVLEPAPAAPAPQPAPSPASGAGGLLPLDDTLDALLGGPTPGTPPGP